MPVIAVRVDEPTHQEFKIWCIKRGMSVQQTGLRLIKDWIAEQERLERKLAELQQAAAQKEEMDGTSA